MAALEGLIAGPFAAALEAGRTRFNALFAQSRRAMPALDPEAFAGHLCAVVAPIVDAVAGAAPDRASAVVEALFELSLELVGHDLAGRCPDLTDGWKQLLGALPAHLAGEPRRFAGSMANALYQLSTVPGARPAEWVEIMSRLGPLALDAGTLLEAGKVVAWRAGLAPLRESALETCRRLEPPLARAALGLSAAGSLLPLDTVLQQLQADPWLRPFSLGQPVIEERALRIAGRAGAFRGFGGPFLDPPRVALAGGRFVAADTEACWALAADCFGITLHRVGSCLPETVCGSRAVFQIDRNGTVTARGQTRLFPELSGWTSFAADATTLAVTVPLSHAVYLVAFAE